MLTYYILFAVWSVFALLISCKKSVEYRCPSVSSAHFTQEITNRKIAWFFAFTLFLVMGFRSVEVGTDTLSYYLNYINSTSNSLSQFDGIEYLTKEFGYTLLVVLFHNVLHFPWQVFVMMSAAFFCFALTKFICKYSSDVFLSFFFHATFGLFAMSITGIRQTLAISIILIALNEMIDKHYSRYIFLVLLASTIHFSAIVCVFVFFIGKLNYKNGGQLVLFAIFPIIIRILGSTIIKLALPYLPVKYTYSGYFSVLNLQINPLTEAVYVFLLVACAAGMYLSHSIKPKDFHLYVLSCVFLSCFELSHTVYMASRLSFYFITPLIVLITNIIRNQKDARIRVALYLGGIILSFSFFVITIPGSSYGIATYHVFF